MCCKHYLLFTMARGKEIARSKGKRRVIDVESHVEDVYETLAVADRAVQELSFDEERREYVRTIEDLHRKLAETLIAKEQVVLQTGVWERRYNEL